MTEEEEKELREEVAALTANFEINWNCTQRAIKMWQKAYPGNDHVWPDKAELMVWLMEQIDALTLTKFEKMALSTMSSRTEDVTIHGIIAKVTKG